MLYHTKTINETFRELDANGTGLAGIEVKERQKEYGLNLIKIKKEPLWKKIIEPFVNVFMPVLLVAALISVWQNAIIDAIIIFVIMFISAAIFYIQRFSTERILRALQKNDPYKVSVIRENRHVSVEAESLVPGDIIILNEGDKIPADARLIQVYSLRIDESQLTGESLPIEKQVEAISSDSEVYERSNMVYSGSFVVGGEAKAIVVATGENTEFGRIAALSSQEKGVETSPIQKKIDKLVSQIIFVIIAISIIVFVMSVWRGMDYFESIRFVLALAVSAVPEGLPVAIAVVLALGMHRMAARKALVRSMSAIETIGALTTIATDKTGTLTKNKLTVLETWSPKENSHVLNRTLSLSVNHSDKKIYDPLDIAMSDYVAKESIVPRTGLPETVLKFDQAVSMSGNVWKSKNEYMLFVKGAPEHLLYRCQMPHSKHKEAESVLHSMAGNGFRVIALAHCSLGNDNISSFDNVPESAKFVFDGFIAVADILRPEAKEAIRRAAEAGIIVRMVTGDHFETAFHIGRSLGMVENSSQVFDCRKLDSMSDEELRVVINEIRVFSRVIPEYKYRILSILKESHIVAMTGDGVNDVPALANAHVGIAMGSGSQIAKEAGSIILIDDNFKRIVDAIHEGRTIYANIKRMLVYLLSTNLGEVMVSLGALVVGLPIPLVPIQILWINLVTDSFLAIPLGLEPGEWRNMKKGPQAPGAPLFSRFMISRIAIISVTMASVVLIQYAYFYEIYGHQYARGIAFCSLVVMQWASALCARSDYEPLARRIFRFNGPFIIGLVLAVSLQVLAIGPLRELLYVSDSISLNHIFWAGAVAFVVQITVIEIHKLIGRYFFNKGSKPLKFKKNNK